MDYLRPAQVFTSGSLLPERRRTVLSSDKTSKQLLHPPIGISHTTDSVEDLYAQRLEQGQHVLLHPAVQPNSFPHLGSVTTLCSTFAIAQRIRDRLGVIPYVWFWELENAPAEVIDVDGVHHFRSLGDTVVDGDSLSERHLRSFRWLLKALHELSGVSYERYSYNDFQQRWDARGAVLRILDATDRIAPLLCPSHPVFKVRFPCPTCRLMEKAGGKLEDLDQSSRTRTYRNQCPEHGEYFGVLAADNDQWFDTNTPVRALAREVIITEHFQRSGAHNLMSDGSDWAHYAALNMESLSHLGLPIRSMPMRFFAPVVLDWSGPNLLSPRRWGRTRMPQLRPSTSILRSSALRSATRSCRSSGRRSSDGSATRDASSVTTRSSTWSRSCPGRVQVVIVVSDDQKVARGVLWVVCGIGSSLR